jgi:CheY-like chemotaxis protein
MIVMHDGEEAIHYLEACVARTPARTSPIPDVLLLDVKMPRVNGFEVLTWIRSQSELAHLPVVMFSSSDLPADLEASQKLGATDYWLKTADSQKLIGLVRELRDRWLPAAA